MDFKNKRISKDSKPKTYLNPKQKVQILTIVGSIIVLGGLLIGTLLLVKSLDFSSIIFSFGKNLQTDRHGHTNILLAGVGGENHDGGDLTDTLMVASIDYDKKLVSMLSIPRDLWVKSTKLNSSQKINAMYYLGKKQLGSKGGMEELKQIVSNVVNVPIDYFVKIDFSGFKKIVNSLGGVDVIVEKDIYDTQYPLGETVEYQTFSIKAGPQHLDGDTALKYARSRHGKGNESGDYSRAKRQQQLLEAIKNKALNLNILADADKIQSLYNSVSSSIETDFSVSEIIELAKTGKDFGKESIVSYTINDNPGECGGLIYNPAREYFGGASVALPAGNNYESFHIFAQNIFYNTATISEQAPIQILNGTKTPNLAGQVLNILGRYCYNVIYYGNAQNRALTTSTIYYKPLPDGTPPKTLGLITKMLPIKTQAGIPTAYLDNEKKQKTAIVIELGADYLNNKLKDPFNDLPYYLAPKTADPKQQTTQQTTQQINASKPKTPPSKTNQET